MISNKNTEWFPVVDETGKNIDKAPRSVCHDGKSMLLHPVVHLHLFNPAGELYLQKRALSKDVQPGKWDTSVGGHLNIGESPEEAVKREAEEELGIQVLNPVFLTRYIWTSSVERELVTSYKITSTEIPVINQEEIDTGRFWKIDEIRSVLGKEVFTPNFENEFSLLFSKIK